MRSLDPNLHRRNQAGDTEKAAQRSTQAGRLTLNQGPEGRELSPEKQAFSDLGAGKTGGNQGFDRSPTPAPPSAPIPSWVGMSPASYSSIIILFFFYFFSSSFYNVVGWGEWGGPQVTCLFSPQVLHWRELYLRGYTWEASSAPRWVTTFCADVVTRGDSADLLLSTQNTFKGQSWLSSSLWGLKT